MAPLASGYVIPIKPAMALASRLGAHDDENDDIYARMHINRALRAIDPKAPVLRTLSDQTPLKDDPDGLLAYILVTRYDDDKLGTTFEERPVDLRVKRKFAGFAGVEEGVLVWYTMLRWW